MNPIVMIQEYQKFRVKYLNDPQKAYKELQEKLLSGQMNQQQLNDLQRRGKEFVEQLNSIK